MSYTNIHRHTTHSIYDGAGTPEQGVVYAKSLGQTSLSITDHGTMAGVVEHYLACVKHEIKPILGVESYFQPRFTPEKDAEYYHMTMIAQSNEGYENLCRLTTASHRDKFYRHPICDFEILQAYKKGVIVLSGCPRGFIPQMIIQKKMHIARKATEKFLKLYGDCFFFEVQPPTFEDAKIANEGILQLSKEFGRPAVMTSDSHYVRKDEFDTYTILRRMPLHEEKQKPSEENKEKMLQWEETLKCQYGSLYMPSEEEILAFWKHAMGTDGQQYVDNTQRIVDMCDVQLNFPEMVPKVETDGPPEKAIQIWTRKTLESEGKWGITQEKNGEISYPYKERLRYELGIIIKKGFPGYFLLVADLIKWARENGVPVGPGRGSVCGSLTAYALGITKVDPIQHGIMFERFMTPARTSMPDIDNDFCSLGRDRVIAYAMQKYAGKAAPMGNLIRFKTDNLINALGKVLRVPASEIESIKLTLETTLYDKKHLSYQELMKNENLRVIDETYSHILLHFTRLYGQITTIGKHAAGLAVTAQDVESLIPLISRADMKGKRSMQTAYDKKALEGIGIVKIDMLGLTTVTMLSLMEKISGLSTDAIPLDDDMTFEAFRNGDTNGIFQLEKRGAKDILMKIEPNSFQDIIAALAINRPGVSNQLPSYVNGKKNGIDPSSPYAAFTQDSYGAIIYHEGVMNICHELAGLDWTLCYKIIKRIDQPVDIPYQTAFVEGIINNPAVKMTEAEAKALYYTITRYSFNKGHSAGYALVSYYMMYYKVHYPLAFYYGSLSYTSGEYKQVLLQSEALKRGIVIFLPHVNGTAHYSIIEIEGEKGIQIGTNTLKGVGAIASTIEKCKPYIDEADLLEKVKTFQKRKLNANVLESLRKVGALEFDLEKYHERVENYCAKLFARRSMN